MRKNSRSTPKIKRIFDIIFALAALIILSPIILLIMLAVLMTGGLPIFFTQIRPGKDGVPFRLNKFRTMQETKDLSGDLLEDEKRITRFGKFLRKSSLDELPELWNVLKGEMSIVGPRPLLMQYLNRYSDEQARRNEVLPGISGWAQINGRNAITWDEKLTLDVWYVDHWTFWLDIQIIFQTIWKVIKGEGVSPPGKATMDEFMGNEKK